MVGLAASGGQQDQCHPPWMGLLEDELRVYQDMLQFKFIFIFQVLLEQEKLGRQKKTNPKPEPTL